MADDLSLTVGGRVLSGWEDLAVTVGCDSIPSSFSLIASDANPLLSDAVMVTEGDPCTVKLGADLVVTGYIDSVEPGYDARGHEVRIEGRGKCQDLVDCSAEWKGFQISGCTALDIANKLGAAYGVTASVLGGDAGPIVPQFNISLGDTPVAVLEKVSRQVGLLYYEAPDGNLVLARAGSTAAASGFAEGQNVQTASWRRGMDTRYSEYDVSNLSIDTSGIIQDQAGLFRAQAFDTNVKRNRKLYVIADGIEGALQTLVAARANWEAARRYGRSRAVRVTADSWRDSAGKLWAPNTRVMVDLPRLQLPRTELVIASVTFRAGASTGKVADVTLMPIQAFALQPIQLQPILPDLPAASGAFGG